MLSKLRKSEDGVITIEAAMVIPIILTFILALLTIVQIAIAEMALQESVSEGAQTMSHYGYLAQQGAGLIQNETDAMIGVIEERGSEAANHGIIEYILSNAADKGKGALGELITNLSNGLQEDASNKLVKSLYEERVGSGGFFNASAITVTSNVSDGENVEITAEVPLEVVLPFFSRTLTIKKKAVEQVWNGA